MIRLGDEILKGENVYFVGVFEMLFEPSSGVEVAEFPSFTAKNQIGFRILILGVEDLHSIKYIIKGKWVGIS